MLGRGGLVGVASHTLKEYFCRISFDGPDNDFSPCHVDEEDAMRKNDANPEVIEVTW